MRQPLRKPMPFKSRAWVPDTLQTVNTVILIVDGLAGRHSTGQQWSCASFSLVQPGAKSRCGSTIRYGRFQRRAGNVASYPPERFHLLDPEALIIVFSAQAADKCIPFLQ